MQDKVNQFANAVYGVPQEAEDPSNKFQCFDLAFKWCDALGIPREAIRHFYAKDIFLQANDTTRKYFDIVYNGPNNKPSPGALIVFGTQIGYAGHVSLETGKSDSINLTTLDQNWNGLLYPRWVTHWNYYGVLGWLQPKLASVPLTDTQKLAAIRTIVNGTQSGDEKINRIRPLVS